MNTTYEQLVEDLPPRSSPRGDAPTGARDVRERVAHLPLASPELAAREIGTLLEDMLRSLWTGGERIEALEALRVPLAGLCDGYERQLQNESHPLPTAKVRLAETALEFQRRLARNYALAVHELCSPAGGVPLLKRRVVALALVRALGHARLALLWSYRLYRTPPAGLWRQLHALYRFAAESGLETRRAEDVAASDAFAVDARSAYAHALLLALSNPYRYSLRELGDAEALTRWLAPHAAIGVLRGDGAAFALDTDADRGPGYLPEERQAGRAGQLALDVAPALAFLAREATLRPGANEALVLRTRDRGALTLGRAFIERAVHGWAGGAAPREHARIGAVHELDTVIGMHGLHYMLAGRVDFDHFMHEVRGAAITLGEQAHAASWAAAGGDAARLTTQRARVIDQSLGGYRLLWNAGTAVRTRIGELVGLALPPVEGEPQEWMVGVLRWLRVDGDGQVDAGVELLARRALAAGVRTLAGGAASAPMRGILLRGDAGDATELLVPALFDRSARLLEVASQGLPDDWRAAPRVERCRVAEVSEASGAYYRVSLAPSAAAAAGGSREN
ncbi:hypothetical protein MBSD_n0011 [Mizugakiibacter sediminis]|uniref:Uncharacterized protein n=1 Tax=Mizugakiibacter sediminis TaxID=1475481 RepID=A0A0K8QIT6_9GAMM|nr:hypothetical protein [Mizugakiibacter sediminis]GAP64729.1 hypothetical protein MBSD_n0011 [Mizugakiibacter sediminis]